MIDLKDYGRPMPDGYEPVRLPNYNLDIIWRMDKILEYLEVLVGEGGGGGLPKLEIVYRDPSIDFDSYMGGYVWYEFPKITIRFNKAVEILDYTKIKVWYVEKATNNITNAEITSVVYADPNIYGGDTNETIHINTKYIPGIYASSYYLNVVIPIGTFVEQNNEISFQTDWINPT